MKLNTVFLLFLILLLIILFSSCNPLLYYDNVNIAHNGNILFDNAHSQTAGNADWTITGGFSDFADDLKNLGYKVAQYGNDETGKNQIDDDDKITLSVLEKYSVYIIPEPNIPFTKDEQNAIIQYIKDGGGVFFIADHYGADRNNDGWDATEIFDGFEKGDHNVKSKSHYSNDFVGKLGFRFYFDKHSQHPITDISDSPITKNVKSLGEWSGSTEYILDNDRVEGVVYLSNRSYGPYVLYGTYGKGRFVAIGDSSPIDDGSGAPGNKLYDGYNVYDDAALCKNVVNWLNGD